jgi:hypothetical protein
MNKEIVKKEENKEKRKKEKKEKKEKKKMCVCVCERWCMKEERREKEEALEDGNQGVISSRREVRTGRLQTRPKVENSKNGGDAVINQFEQAE